MFEMRDVKEGIDYDGEREWLVEGKRCPGGCGASAERLPVYIYIYIYALSGFELASWRAPDFTRLMTTLSQTRRRDILHDPRHAGQKSFT
jgi:hypothetical protein